MPAKSAAVSAADSTARVNRRNCAKSGSAGVMSGMPRAWLTRKSRPSISSTKPGTRSSSVRDRTRIRGVGTRFTNDRVDGPISMQN
jgi:hypothetical protein